MNKKIIYSTIILTLSLTNLYLYYQNNIQEQKLNQLENEYTKTLTQEKFINEHQTSLTTIKTLKQEILGQEQKLEELSKQIQSFTKELINNQEKLNEMEN